MEESKIRRNTKLAREVIWALENADIPTFKRILDPDADLWVSGDVIFSRQLKKGHQMIDAFQGVGGGKDEYPFHYTVMETTAEDDRVALRVHCMKRMPSGKLYDNQFHFLFKFNDDGVIYEWYEYGDSEMITWALCDGNRPYPLLSDEQRIEAFLAERAKWEQDDGFRDLTPADFGL